MKQALFIGLVIVMAACSPGRSAAAVPGALPSTPSSTTTVKAIPVSPAASATDANFQPYTSAVSILEEQAPSLKVTVPGCLSLVKPKDGETFPEGADVDFDWEDQAKASYYVVLLVHANGKMEKIQSPSSTISLKIPAETVTAAGRWTVLPYDANGDLISSTTMYSFTVQQTQKKTDTSHAAAPPAEEGIASPIVLPPPAANGNTPFSPKVVPGKRPTILVPRPPPPTRTARPPIKIP